MSFPPPSLKLIASEVVALLISRKETISLVETATGGLVASTILSLPGTSVVFRGGVNAYNLETRKAFLGWTDEDSAKYNGPSEAIVLRLAQSLNKTLSTTYTLSESGVAGPSRPTKYRADIKGPGYCPIALVASDGMEKTVTLEVEQPREREENMVAFAEGVLKLLLEVLKEREKSGPGKL